MLVNEKIPPGTVLTIIRMEEIHGRRQKVRRRYRVLRQFRHHVMTVSGGGSQYCITNAELFQNGIVTQRIDDVPEWMRRNPRRHGANTWRKGENA